MTRNADATVLRRVRIGAHQREHRSLRWWAFGGPDFLPVDHVLVAVARGARGQRGEVRAGARFGVALRPEDLTGEDAGQVGSLLLVAAVHDDRGAEHAHALPADVGRGGLGDLLLEDELLHRAQAAAAVLLRPVRGEPAALGERLGPLVRGLSALRIAGGAIGDPAALGAVPDADAHALAVPLGQALLDQRLHLGAKRGLLLGVFPVHRASSGCVG